MDDILRQGTESTPEIEFKKTGKLSIKGKSLPEDPKRFYDPLFKWAKELSTEQVELNIKLEYVNTSSSKRIIELLKIIDDNRDINKIDLSWHYELDDQEMLEFGEMIQRNLKRTKANYIGYEDD